MIWTKTRAGSGTYPDFLGIGAQKAGTTWLGRNLGLHPQVWMPPLKEIHYFDEKIHEPANAVPRFLRRLVGDSLAEQKWRRQVKKRASRHLRAVSGKGSKGFSRERLLWDLRYYFGEPDDDWYASLFEGGAGRVKGEITPAYSTLDRGAVARVHALVPDAKILFMLRNPVERAWSQTVMHLGKVEKRDVGSVKQERLLRSFGIEGSLLRTGYLRALETWGAFYPPERVFVGFLEDVDLFPAEFLGRVYEFLGVDDSFRPPGVEEKVHTRSRDRVPTAVLAHLARLYRDEILGLDERFGGYAGFWRHCAERLIEDPPDEPNLPYPLWGSYLREEWLAGAGAPRPQSGPLSAIRVAG